MSEATKPRPPSDLQERGRRFWRQTLGEFELSIAERAILHETCRVLDEIDQLRAAVASEGVTVEGSNGQPRHHPALDALGRSRTMLGRLVAQLQLPDADGDPVPSVGSLKARKAADARWRPHRVAQGAGDGPA